MTLVVVLTSKSSYSSMNQLGEKVKIAILSIIAVLMFVPIALADVFVTSDGTGTYVGGLPGLTPNGAYIGGTPTITIDGFYVDGTPKKKYRPKKWQQFKATPSFKLSSSLKTNSK